MSSLRELQQLSLARACSQLRQQVAGEARLSRRGFVHAGVLGTSGLSLANLLRSEATAAEQRGSHLARTKEKNNVIILWMRGGPSHIDMWDPKRSEERR